MTKLAARATGHGIESGPRRNSRVSSKKPSCGFETESKASRSPAVAKSRFAYRRIDSQHLPEEIADKIRKLSGRTVKAKGGCL